MASFIFTLNVISVCSIAKHGYLLKHTHSIPLTTLATDFNLHYAGLGILRPPTNPLVSMLCAVKLFSLSRASYKLMILKRKKHKTTRGQKSCPSKLQSGQEKTERLASDQWLYSGKPFIHPERWMRNVATGLEMALFRCPEMKESISGIGGFLVELAREPCLILAWVEGRDGTRMG